MSNPVRILLAGVLGGLAMMVWTSVAHIALPLGQVGVQNLPQAEAIRGSMGAAVGTKPGLYFFPAMDPKATDQGEAMAAYEAASRAGPSGFVVYRPAGGAPSMATSIPLETGKLILVALVCAVLLSFAGGLSAYAARAGFVLAIGAVATLTTNFSYFAWYGFPGDYTGAQFAIDLVAFLVGGLVIAAFVKPPRGLRA